MAARLAFSVDLDRCIGCGGCVVACGSGNEAPPGGAFTAVTDLVRSTDGVLWGSFSHHRCFHCGSAPCVEVCPTGALSKWNGLTVVAAERCSGCGYCTDACPFRVPRVRERQVAKCVACLDLVQDGKRPWCETTCPTQAIRLGERDEVLAEARDRAAALRGRYPAAQVYGDAQLDGLGLLLVLLDQPAAYGLPEAPRAAPLLASWKAVKPAAIGLSAGTAVGMGLLFVVARRQHLREEARQAGTGKGEPEP